MNRHIRCCFCPFPALYIFWFQTIGYRWPCCTTCFPKATAANGDSQTGALALDGSRIYETGFGADGGAEHG